LNIQDISYRNIIRISAPLLVSYIAQNIIAVTDTAFLGRLGEVAIGAGGNGTLLYIIFVMVGMGFTTGLQIIIGRRNGEANFTKVGPLLQQGFYFIIALAFLLFLFMFFFSGSFLELTVKSDAILKSTTGYIQHRSFGIFFSLINLVFLAFFIGTTNTKILTLSTLFTAGINVFLDYVLIFGEFGFPQMGVNGAAIASAISEGIGLLFVIVYTLIYIDLKKYDLFKIVKVNIGKIKEIIKIGGPIMLQNFISLSAWFIFFSIIEHIGERELAISHIIRSIYMVIMMPIFALSNTTNTLVSNLIGQHQYEQINPLIKRITVLAFCINIFMLVINMLTPQQIIGIYTNDISLITDSINTLYIISLTMIVFSFAIIRFSAISGTGNTITALKIEIISIAIYLAVAFISVIYFVVPVEIAWCSEFIYFSILGILSLYYLQNDRLKKIEL
jgi:putative MATE family efflux protein